MPEVNSAMPSRLRGRRGQLATLTATMVVHPGDIGPPGHDDRGRPGTVGDLAPERVLVSFPSPAPASAPRPGRPR